jgi:hypothetical protein
MSEEAQLENAQLELGTDVPAVDFSGSHYPRVLSETNKQGILNGESFLIPVLDVLDTRGTEKSCVTRFLVSNKSMDVILRETQRLGGQEIPLSRSSCPIVFEESFAIDVTTKFAIWEIAEKRNSELSFRGQGTALIMTHRGTVECHFPVTLKVFGQSALYIKGLMRVNPPPFVRATQVLK